MVMKLTGNFIHYGKMNLNGRVYTKEAVEKMVKDFNMMKEGKAESPDGSSGGVAPNNQWYQNNVMLGQLGYPTEGNFTNLSDVSHEVEEIHIDEEKNSIVGTIKILDTPKGKIVKDMIDSDVGLSCRPRSIGTVNENGEIEIEELISFDLIAGNDAFANIKENDYLKEISDE